MNKEYLYKLERLVAQVVSSRSFTAEARVHARFTSCGVCGGQHGTWARVFSDFFGFPCHCLSTMALHTHIPPGV
jgi:hypothetical protein